MGFLQNLNKEKILQAEMYIIFESPSNEFLSLSSSLQEILSQADELTCDYKLVRLIDDETFVIKQIFN